MEMQRRDSLSLPLLHTSHDTIEPPRKRPRPAERELSPATTDSHPAPSPKSFGAATASSHISMPLSTPPSTSQTGDTLDTNGVQMGASSSASLSGSRSTRRSDVSRTVTADGSDSNAEGSGATLLEGLISVFYPACGGGGREGDADEAPPSVKEGKAKGSEDGAFLSASGMSTPTVHDEGSMDWGSISPDTNLNPCSGQGGGMMAKPPFSQHIGDGDGRDLPTREGSHDNMEEPTVRDREFYIDKADCVICVDKTLFRVHRYFLGRDSSAFQHMFSMPARGVEGCSDENPIRLYGECVERFRVLLSVIYYLPLQLQIYNTPAADIDRLVTIAEMTNKYHFTSSETWAVDALYNVICGLHGPPQPQYELGHCSSAWMKRLLEIALLCGHPALRNHVADRWVDRIVARDLRPVHALEIADRSGIRRLQGYAYYVQLLEMGDGFDPGVVEDGKQYSLGTVTGRKGVRDSTSSASARTGTPASLTQEQRHRLLSGHWSLSWLWDTLRMSPPKFQRPDECTYHQQGCVSTWTQAWRDVGKSEATLKHPPGDVLGRLREMEQQLSTHTVLSHLLTSQCKRGALMALKATIKEVQEGLADHFADLIHTQEAQGIRCNAAEGTS